MSEPPAGRGVGRPCWTELPCTDLAVTLPFYTELLGWDYTEPDAALGGYVDATCGDQPLCGLYSLGDEERPSQWLTYLSVDSAEAALSSCVAAGARPVMPVTPHHDRATVAVVATPGHVLLGLWEDLPGHPATGEVQLGGPCWYETTTSSIDRGAQFLQDAFGVTLEHSTDGEWRYGTAIVDDAPAFGTVELPSRPPTPISLMPYFLVPDVDECVAKLPDAGRLVSDGVIESPFGRLALFTGPDLEPFGLFGADSAPE